MHALSIALYRQLETTAAAWVGAISPVISPESITSPCDTYGPTPHQHHDSWTGRLSKPCLFEQSSIEQDRYMSFRMLRFMSCHHLSVSMNYTFTLYSASTQHTGAWPSGFNHRLDLCQLAISCSGNRSKKARKMAYLAMQRFSLIRMIPNQTYFRQPPLFRLFQGGPG